MKSNTPHASAFSIDHLKPAPTRATVGVGVGAIIAVGVAGVEILDGVAAAAGITVGRILGIAFFISCLNALFDCGCRCDYLSGSGCTSANNWFI